jgi:hypothetical protein
MNIMVFIHPSQGLMPDYPVLPRTNVMAYNTQHCYMKKCDLPCVENNHNCWNVPSVPFGKMQYPITTMMYKESLQPSVGR